MSHYAKVRDEKVVQVIVAEEEFFNTFVDTSAGEWIQTSYNTRGNKYYTTNDAGETVEGDQSKKLRGNYAGIGYTYDEDNQRIQNHYLLYFDTCKNLQKYMQKYMQKLADRTGE